MPIRRALRHYYTAARGWPKVQAEVLGRAAWRCECRGECGFRHPGGRCDAPHLTVVGRCLENPTLWSVGELDAPGTYRVRIVLAVAHRNHDPGDNAPENVVAFCQRCHLSHDQAHHRQTSTRRQILEARAAGQCDLFPARQLSLFPNHLLPMEDRR